jgi:uncharacterized membrane protein
MENKKKAFVYIDTVWLLIGELLVAALTVGVYLLLKELSVIEKFSYTVITGGLLGALVATLNFFILSLSVNRAISLYINGRGKEEMSDEEASKYALENGARVKAAVAKSYYLRTAIMIGTLVLAMLWDFVDPLATVMPLLGYRPVLYVTELIKTKFQKRDGE